jgi:hypothetical protein
MKAKSIKDKSTDDIQSALRQGMTDTRLPDGQGFEAK